MEASQIALVEAPDFRHVESWIFDLDHTLYVVAPEIRAAVEERICLFVQRHFGIGRDKAWDIQKRYFLQYGITLAGLMKHHGVDPRAYHDFINDVEVLALEPDPALARALARLPGRCFVFTNNCGRFAGDVIARLGIEDSIDAIWDIHAGNYVPKPMTETYEALIAVLGITASTSAMFEDSQRNLAPAHALGMTTVWFNPAGLRAERPPFIDYETDNLPAFLTSLRIRHG